MILPTFGNNDFQFHYQIPNVTLREGFYNEIMDDWFRLISFNTQHLNYDLVKMTFRTGGYYRVNLPGGRVSVLAMNSIGYSPKNLPNNQGDAQQLQLEWLEEQLRSAESTRKFIIANHIYAGLQSKDGSTKYMWNEEYVREYIAILESFSDRVIVELSGHEHMADIRYNNGSALYPGSSIYEGLSTTTKSKLVGFVGPSRYHNMIVHPGVTSFDGQNSAFTTFRLNETSHIVNNVQMTFLSLKETYGWQKPFPAIETWPWRHLNFTELVGLNEVTAESINSLTARLSADDALLKKYLI